MRRRRLRWTIVPLVLSMALAACGDDGGDGVDAGGSSGGTTSTTSAATTSTAAGGGGFATTTVSTPPERRGLLAKVEATSDGDVDRVTFTFEGELPGYRVGYVPRPIIQDGSGEEVEVDGDAVLEVHFEPASGFDLEGEGRQVYTGPTRLDVATRVVLDVVRTGDFEAVLAWAVGVDGTDVPFRVRTASTPNRVIVEVRAT